MAKQLFGDVSVVSGRTVGTLNTETVALQICAVTGAIQWLVIANEILKRVSNAN